MTLCKFQSIFNLECFRTLHFAGRTLMQPHKTEGRPRAAPLDSRALADMRPLIYVKGFFYTVLSSLREHLQTRGHRRVFKQKGFNVAAPPPPETTVLSLSATFKWHEKLNSCPLLAKRSSNVFGWVSREARKALAEMMSRFLFKKLPHRDTAGRPAQCSIQHCSALHFSDLFGEAALTLSQSRSSCSRWLRRRQPRWRGRGNPRRSSTFSGSIRSQRPPRAWGTAGPPQDTSRRRKPGRRSGGSRRWWRIQSKIQTIK